MVYLITDTRETYTALNVDTVGGPVLEVLAYPDKPVAVLLRGANFTVSVDLAPGDAARIGRFLAACETS